MSASALSSSASSVLQTQNRSVCTKKIGIVALVALAALAFFAAGWVGLAVFAGATALFALAYPLLQKCRPTPLGPGHSNLNLINKLELPKVPLFAEEPKWSADAYSIGDEPADRLVDLQKTPDVTCKAPGTSCTAEELKSLFSTAYNAFFKNIQQNPEAVVCTKYIDKASVWMQLAAARAAGVKSIRFAYQSPKAKGEVEDVIDSWQRIISPLMRENKKADIYPEDLIGFLAKNALLYELEKDSQPADQWEVKGT